MKQWYEELFQDYADKYDSENFTSGKMGEVDFIEKETVSKVLCELCGTSV